MFNKSPNYRKAQGTRHIVLTNDDDLCDYDPVEPDGTAATSTVTDL